MKHGNGKFAISISSSYYLYIYIYILYLYDYINYNYIISIHYTDYMYIVCGFPSKPCLITPRTGAIVIHQLSNKNLERRPLCEPRHNAVPSPHQPQKPGRLHTQWRGWTNNAKGIHNQPYVDPNTLGSVSDFNNRWPIVPSEYLDP
jgi:hypothetical protein